MTVTQQEFREAILDPERPRPHGLLGAKGDRAGRRFDVYRNNVSVSLAEALEQAFPILKKLLGDANFRTLANVYLRQNPPSSPLMMHYGEAMPEFVTGFEPTSNIRYLPDVARLEIALRASYHAADADPIDPGFLQNTPADKLMASALVLAPSLRLLRSPWPVHAIWRFNMEPGAPKPAMAAEDIAVLRPDLDPEPHLLPPGGGALIETVLNGASFGDAVEAATAEAADFDLTQTLALLIGAGAIIDLKELP